MYMTFFQCFKLLLKNFDLAKRLLQISSGFLNYKKSYKRPPCTTSEHWARGLTLDLKITFGVYLENKKLN